MKRRQFLTKAGAGSLALLSFQTFSQHKQEPQWQPDGLGSLARIGLLTLDFDPVPESEIQAMIPAGVSIHSSRVSFNRSQPATYFEAGNIDRPLELFKPLVPNIILSGYTSSSYSIGVSEDERMRERLEKVSGGIRVIFPCHAAHEALKTLGARKIALMHPPWPWFSENSMKGKNYFESLGHEIIFCGSLTPTRKFTEVKPEEVYNWAVANIPKQADVLLQMGNGLRMAGAISALEQHLNIPVVSANQVLLWVALRQFGLSNKVTNYGRIFALN